MPQARRTDAHRRTDAASRAARWPSQYIKRKEEEKMTEMFETLMLICFGLSWPMSVVKSYRSRTAQGKSIFFQIAIIIGYVCGIMSKLTAGNINYVLALYLLNLLMVSVDLTLYFRNRRLDMELARI